ncbi:MAG: family 20 glycosylhydrolase [Candidatus Moduliflexus flocculans]|nr:family 20 glycosylhydrolase [Candidatus Moduliflexus flocculans]
MPSLTSGPEDHYYRHPRIPSAGGTPCKSEQSPDLHRVRCARRWRCPWPAAACRPGATRIVGSRTDLASSRPPVRLEARPGRFELGPSARIVILEGQVDAPARGFLPQGLARASDGIRSRDRGLDRARRRNPGPARFHRAPTRRPGSSPGRGGISIWRSNRRASGSRAAAPAGLFYGVQTLRQLLPAAIEGRARDRGAGPGRSPASRSRTGRDSPGAAALLDCARHFFPKEFVLRWIDILAMHKLNTFHWHLTDDQGWRIEIKKYPRLTEVGAWRVDREDQHWNAREPQRPGETATYGGFYTQDDIREVVAYAAARHITDRPRDRDARARQGRPRRLPRALVHRRAFHRPAGRLLAHHRRLLPRQRRHVRVPGGRAGRGRRALPRPVSSTSAATRSTRPNGSAAPSAGPG